MLAAKLKYLASFDLEFNFDAIGFETAEADILLESTAEATPDADVLPEIAADQTPVSRPGDLWILGKHRLICGSALDALAYRELLQGHLATMVINDPPYSVKIDGHVTGLGQVKHREFAMASGELSDSQFIDFLTTSLGHAVNNSIDDAIHDIFMDWRHLSQLSVAASQVYSEQKNLCVWNKSNAGMGSLYRSKHELVAIYKVGSAPHINNIDLGRHGRYRTNVWDYPGVNTFGNCRDAMLAMHPTVKPVALIADAIKVCSRRGDIILDPFGGSGTTLIAAEKTARVAALIEIDPLYADIVIKRWQSHTGGGSIARIDGGGFLRVGPQSAGAWPGPACYGRGGDVATVSDANLVLGRLNPLNFAGGQMNLDVAAARRVVGALAERLGSDLHKVAYDIIKLSNWNMVNAIRLVSIDKGKDPREFTLMSFGGAGSAHAAALMETLGMREAMIPINQGVLSAYGLTSADMRVDVSQTTNLRSDYFDLAAANRVIGALVARALSDLRSDGFAGEPSVVVAFEMRYLGQNYGIEIPVPVQNGALDERGLAAVFDRFHGRHRQLYGYSIEHEILEITDFNVTAVGPVDKPELPRIGATGRVTPRSRRPVYFEETGGFADCAIYQRGDLFADTALEGPAIVEEDYSLTLVHPGQRLTADVWGNLYITRA